MKKIVFLAISIVLTISMFADNKRAMRVFYNGEIVRSLDASKIDSMNLHFTEVTENDTLNGDNTESSAQLYMGLVAFSQTVQTLPITSDLDLIKTTINGLTNEENQTAFTYAISEGNKLFDKKELPEFDKIFMLNFTDGFDNWSTRLWRDNYGRVVKSDYVYDTVRNDLLQRVELNSYALAFGSEAIKVKEEMVKVVTGSGGYYEATSSDELKTTFVEIAQSMLASSQNAVLQTNAEYYFEDSPKKFQLIFTAEDGSTDVVYASMTGTPSAGYTLSIERIANQFVSFDTPAYGVEDPETKKANIPLNNMKFIKDGKELQFKYQINIQTRDGSLYAEDVEDASSSEEINKRIAIVLVLDRSNSMGDAFEPMKGAAIDFVETMQKKEVDTTKIDIADVDVVWDLNGGTIAEKLPPVITTTYTLPTPSRAGSLFLGWYDDQYGKGTKYTYLTAGWKGTLYAVWANYPTLATSVVGNITSSSAVVTSKVLTNGESSITERGVVYSTSPNPTTADRKVQSGNGIGDFTCTLTSLSPGTTYYVRSYAVNGAGVAYGEEISFKTLASLPTIGASSVSNITSSSATISGSVLSDGGSAVTERGIVYSNSPNPTIEDNREIEIPTQEDLWSRFKVAAGLTTLGTLAEITAAGAGNPHNDPDNQCACRIICGKLNGTMVNTVLGKAEWTWLRDYIMTIQTTLTVDGEVSNIAWRYAVAAFFLQSEHSAWPATANFATAGKPESWGETYRKAHSGVSEENSGSGIGNFVCILSSLEQGTTYYVRAYAINSVGTAYGEQISFSTDNVYEYVDLGLSVKWATCNVGASKPEEYGDYFAWGEVEPKETYNRSTGKWYNGSDATLTKYCTKSGYGTVDNKTVLESADDAAAVNWGGSWRMPTDAELTELREQCTWTWTTQNGVEGYKVTSKKSGYTNKSIFLPAAGFRYDSSLLNAGSYGYFWSSSLNTDGPDIAWRVNFDSDGVNRSSSYRFYGLSVRPVRP